METFTKLKHKAKAFCEKAKPQTSLDVGHSIEAWVASRLLKQGYKTVCRNYRSPFGEIDLILSLKNELIFVEVRYRQSSTYGGGLESVTKNKQRKIIKTAEYFLNQKAHYQTYFCRFDVVSVTGCKENRKMTWIRGAFEVE